MFNEEVGNANNTGPDSTYLVDLTGRLLYGQMGDDFVGAELATGTHCHRTAMLSGETVATQINNR